ncbi:hypothetical protein [Lentibacillus saliphilus]|uniref:hypothetical protein n=1 Tax=Lentibacillus saliphilus TaxID=2737028 RepID=UPI001C30BBEA|nr:hypothetical protein [Lentibacillus saliphilus]
MNIGISYAAVALLAIFFSYILMKEVSYLFKVHKNKEVISKRLLAARYIATFSIAGFLISFILNIAIYFQIFNSDILTSNITAIACFLFVLVILILEYGVIPKINKTNQI